MFNRFGTVAYRSVTARRMDGQICHQYRAARATQAILFA